MKTAEKVIIAIASIFTVLMAGFGLSSNHDDKITAIYFMFLAVGTWAIYIFLALRNNHIKNQTALSVTPPLKIKSKRNETQQTERPALAPPPTKLITSPPPSKPLTVPIPKDKKVLGSPDPKKPVNRIPFPTGPGDLWKEYTSDIFDDISKNILWQWHYDGYSGKTPRNITACCLDCSPPRPFQVEVKQTPNRNASFYLLGFECSIHGSEGYKTFDSTPSGKHFGIIEKWIQRKLEDGSWFEALNKQRRAMGLPEHNPSMAPQRRLDEIKEEILMIIWKLKNYSAYCERSILEEYMAVFQRMKGNPDLDREMLDHHIRILLNEPRYIKEERDELAVIDGYSLRTPGSTYVIERKLTDTDRYQYLCEYISKQQEPDSY